MTYQEFQQKRSALRTKELEERAADIASPRPPLNNSITDQMLRELFDRVSALEGKSKQAASLEPTVVNLPFAPTARPFALPSEKK